MSPPFRDQNNYKGNNLENIHTRDMVHVHDAMSEWLFKQFERVKVLLERIISS